jgi:hypothetical protein
MELKDNDLVALVVHSTLAAGHVAVHEAPFHRVRISRNGHVMLLPHFFRIAETVIETTVVGQDGLELDDFVAASYRPCNSNEDGCQMPRWTVSDCWFEPNKEGGGKWRARIDNYYGAALDTDVVLYNKDTVYE